jgi:hypothetical protein
MPPIGSVPVSPFVRLIDPAIASGATGFDPGTLVLEDFEGTTELCPTVDPDLAGACLSGAGDDDAGGGN